MNRAVLLSLIAVMLGGAAEHTLATRDFFYVGGKYAGSPGKEVMEGQMYVEVLRPQRVTRKYPIVFFHGNWQTATNWLGTPDGRPGWADYFLGQGYVLYLVDQPARGRSAWHSSVNSPLGGLSIHDTEQRFTASEVSGTWAQAEKHTQWPGDGPKKGQKGDPIFDQFFATQVESMTSAVETQTLIQAAGSALLDKIGPAIVVTHSQSGSFGWILADSRPKLVKAILAAEPNGPPFQNAVVNEDKNRAWGMTDIPITYDTPAKSQGELATVREKAPDGPGLTACWKQADPPRKLPHLAGIPILIVTSESSNHAVYDHCTSKYLAQAGVPNTFWRLEEQGIHGNGHMMMLEKNSLEIAALLQKWITAHVQ